MAAPTIDTSNILVGFAFLHVAAADEPAPADTVAHGGDPGGNWRYTGATEEGWSLGFEREVNDHFVEEQSASVFTTPGNGALTLSGSLAEVTLENMLLALGGGSLATQAAASGVIGKKTLTLSDQYDSYAVLLDGLNPEGFFRRVYIPRARSVASLEVAFRRNEQKQLFNVTLTSNSALDDIIIVDKTANALA